MLASLLAAASVDFTAPTLDWHALAPEVILTSTIVIVLLVDLFTEAHNKYLTAVIGGVCTLSALIPITALAVAGTTRTMFGAGYVVDDFALVMKAFFLVAA